MLYLLSRLIVHYNILKFRHFYSSSINMSAQKELIAVCQMCSNEDIENNFKICKELITSSSIAGAKVIFLPEAFDYIAENKEKSISMAETLQGTLVSRYCKLAAQQNVWLSLGGFHEKISDEKISNSHIVINNEGKIVAKYAKIHLFDAFIPSKRLSLKESSYVKKGEEILPPISTPVGKLGLSICYDVRFPELSLALKSMGAQIIAYPSAFSFPTGAHHWEVLLRARAIENQVYIVAAAQVGFHTKTRQSWGHAMVVDPFGTVIAQCSEGNGYALARVDLDFINKLATEMPIQEHKRLDLYPSLASLRTNSNNAKLEENFFVFGQVKVPKEVVFFTSKYSFAFTNKRCVLPGHVLVAPLRSVPYFEELTTTEILDLFKLVQEVDIAVRKLYNCDSSTISIQNGQHAGQTIKHLHVHILPRKENDFEENDNIYNKLQEHDKYESGDRTLQEMSSEAQLLQKYFT